MNPISNLIKNDEVTSLKLLRPLRDQESLGFSPSVKWGHSKKVPLYNQKGNPYKRPHPPDLLSDFPASSTVSLCCLDHPDLVHCYNSLVKDGIEKKKTAVVLPLTGPPLILFTSWGRQLMSIHTGKTSNFLWLPIHLKDVISSDLLRDSAKTYSV